MPYYHHVLDKQVSIYYTGCKQSEHLRACLFPRPVLSYVSGVKNMDINQLKQVVAIADTGSIFAASEKLYLSRPAISKSLSKFEAELGADVFVRHSSGVSLTREGKRLLPRIRQAVEAFEQVEREAIDLKKLHNTVHLGFVYGAQRLLDEKLSAFCAAHPDIRIENSFISNDDAVKALKSGQLDLCCCGQLLDEPVTIHYPVHREPVYYGVCANSPAAKRGYITHQEYNSSILLGPTDGNNGSFVKHINGNWIRAVSAGSGYIHSDDMLYLCSRVKESKGVLGMPRTLSASFRFDGVVFVPGEAPEKHWELSVHYLAKKPTAAMKLLLDEVFPPLA